MLIVAFLVSMFSCLIFPSEKEDSKPVSWKRDRKREQLGHISLIINEAVCCHNFFRKCRIVVSQKEPLVVGTCILPLNQKTLGIKDPQVFKVLHRYNELRRAVDRRPYSELKNINSWQLHADEVVLGWFRADMLTKIQDPFHPDYFHKDAIENMVNQQRIALYEQLKIVDLYRQDHITHGACEGSSCFYDACYALQRDINTGTKSKDQVYAQFLNLDRIVSEQSVLIDPSVWSGMKQKLVSALSVYGIEKVKKPKHSQETPQINSLLFQRYFFSEAETIAQRILFQRLDREVAEEELRKKEEEIHLLRCSPEAMQYAQKSLNCIRTLLEENEF